MDNRPGAMTSVDQSVSDQPGIIPQVTGALTHARLWSATVFVDHNSDYCYTKFIRRISDEETLRAKEAYERLEATHRSRFYTYREDKGIFSEPKFK